MTTTLSINGLIEIPEAFRKADALEPGQRCEIERTGRGEYRVRVAAPQKERLMQVLMSCPVKDWWVELDRGERTSLEASSLFEE